MGDSLFILIVAPIVEVEVLLVVGRSCLWEVLDGVDGNAGLVFSFTVCLQVLGCPVGSLHIWQRLGLLELCLDLVVQERNAVFHDRM